MKFLLIILLIIPNLLFCQDQSKMILQNQFKGGVCTVGFDIIGWGYSESTQSIPYFIEPNSTVSKVYMFYTIQNNLDSLSYKIGINNQTFHLLQNDVTTPFFNVPQIGIGAVYTHTGIIDCTSAFQNNTTPINIELSTQPFGLPLYRKLFFIIEYTNPNLSVVNYAVYINEENIKANHSYILNTHNKMDISQSISLGLINQSICSANDSYDISINNVFIGNIHSGDQINNGNYCTGASAHFYHQNNTTYGLDDDTPDNIMDSTDALANIYSYITNLNSFSIQYDYQSNNNTNPLGNSPIAMVLAYTPDCDATGLTVGFTDTTICKGESINLNASGGVRYVWEPSTYLSDSTVANPICTAQQPTWYTCTMYTADTCSKTIPVFVDVLTPPTLSITTTPDTCGYNTGSIINSAQGISPLNYALNGGASQTDSVFTNLANGNYSVMVTDGNGCSTAQNTTVENINITQALFTATPNVATAPTEVEFVNQSTDATNTQWYILEDTFYTQNANYTFTDTGLYNMMLIAYNNTLNCSDTTYGTVQIVPPLFINIPNVITPNNDQINDIFSIDIEGAKAIHCTIFNRWGNQLFTYEEPVTPYLQTLNIWDAVTADNSIYSDGTYFYVIYVVTPTNLRQSYTGTIQVFGE